MTQHASFLNRNEGKKSAYVEYHNSCSNTLAKKIDCC